MWFGLQGKYYKQMPTPRLTAVAIIKVLKEAVIILPVTERNETCNEWMHKISLQILKTGKLRIKSFNIRNKNFTG